MGPLYCMLIYNRNICSALHDVVVRGKAKIGVKLIMSNRVVGLRPSNTMTLGTQVNGAYLRYLVAILVPTTHRKAWLTVLYTSNTETLGTQARSACIRCLITIALPYVLSDLIVLYTRHRAASIGGHTNRTGLSQLYLLFDRNNGLNICRAVRH